MTAAEISSKKKYKRVLNTIQGFLVKEIELMREMLANLHQEELSLLENDKRTWARIAEERSDLVVNLKGLREGRHALGIQLEALSIELKQTELFPAKDESSCEILSILDQLLALMDRTNLQNCRNDALFIQAAQKESSPLSCTYPHPLHQSEHKRRKTSVATYPKKS
ncbi:MAG: hypothetical protein KR126chlam1_01141 [Chlamydiae bacterium]|nr:hypothetical protein [Chlamydiota bacterium]